MKLIKIIRKIINPLKLDLIEYPNIDLRRRKKLLKHHRINKIFDVGANSGQYAEEIFKLGFTGKIISFEPVKGTFENLLKKANKNNNWTALNYGFGNKEEVLEINLSENTYSSSLLDIMPSHTKSAPESKVVGKEKVYIKTLDKEFEDLIQKNDNVLLKIDVQGFEKNVLDGAIKSLEKISGIQIEMSVEELYKNEMLCTEMMIFIRSLGFKLYSLENGFYDNETGKLLQVDGIFFRN